MHCWAFLIWLRRVTRRDDCQAVWHRAAGVWWEMVAVTSGCCRHPGNWELSAGKLMKPLNYSNRLGLVQTGSKLKLWPMVDLVRYGRYRIRQAGPWEFYRGILRHHESCWWNYSWLLRETVSPCWATEAESLISWVERRGGWHGAAGGTTCFLPETANISISVTVQYYKVRYSIHYSIIKYGTIYVTVL